MVGAVRTKEKCPRCGSKFAGEPLRCPSCLTIPRRYFVDFSWPGQGRIKLYTDQQGYPLDSWERATRLLNAIRYEIDQGKFDPKEYVKQELKSLLFENYAMEWLKRRESEYQHRLISKSYLKSLKEYTKNYYVPFFGKKSIRDIREGHLEDFKNWLPCLSTKTIYNIMGGLRKLLMDAYRRRDILVMPQFPKVHVSEAATNWISEEEQEKLLTQVADPVYRAFYLFLMKQGCRPNEARALKWGDINLKENVVVIRSAFDMNEYRPFTKEKDVRVLPLHPRVKEALLKLPRSLGGFVFVNRHGRALSARRVYENWRKAAKLAGVEVTCYEGTRHSLASQAVNHGVSMRLVKEFLGHKSEKSTCRYAKVMVSSLTKIWSEK
jgi:integrase